MCKGNHLEMNHKKKNEMNHKKNTTVQDLWNRGKKNPQYLEENISF